MKVFAAALIAMLGCIFAPSAVRAADACRECREFHKACIKNHSKAACKVDYDICMKHCRQK